MINKIFALILFSALSILSLAAHAQDSYDGTILTIPKVAVGQTLYRDVKITVGQLLGLEGGKPRQNCDVYDPINNILNIGNVNVGTANYTNVAITLGQILAVGDSGPLSLNNGGNACGIPIFKTSYENKNLINFDDTQVFTLRALGIPKLYADEQDSNERSVAFANFFNDGMYSAFVSSNRSANLYKNPDINDIPGVAFFLSQDSKGVWRDRTSELIKKLEDRATCVNTSYSVVADFNNDGKPDIYISCSGVDYDISSLGYSAAEQQERYTSNQLVYLSQSDGTYKRVEIPFRIYAHQAAAADINGDGFIDIVTVSASDPNLLKVAVLLGRGDGSFTQTFDKNLVPSSINIETLHNIWGVSVIPIDGRLDLILNGGPPFVTYWVKGNGKNGFDFSSVKKIMMPNSMKYKTQYSFPLDAVYEGGNFYFYTSSQWDPNGVEWTIIKYNINTSSSEIIYTWDNLTKTFQSYSGQFKPTASGSFVAFTGGCGSWGDANFPVTGVLSKIGGCAMNVKFK
jgi:hypothetical protein